MTTSTSQNQNGRRRRRLCRFSCRFRHNLDQSRRNVLVTRKVHKDMKIGSKEWEENSEDVQKRSYEPNDDGDTKLLQFGKGEKSLTVAKFNHSYTNSPAVFKEFNNVKELSNWLRNSAVMVCKLTCAVRSRAFSFSHDAPVDCPPCWNNNNKRTCAYIKLVAIFKSVDVFQASFYLKEKVLLLKLKNKIEHLYFYM